MGCFESVIFTKTTLLLLLTVCLRNNALSSSSSEFSYSEKCFISSNSKISWTITFNNLTLVLGDVLKMQTKSTTPFEGEWKNLTGCGLKHLTKSTGYGNRRNRSLMCELNDDWFRLTYNVRVVRLNTHARTHPIVLFQKNNQYQHGLLCYKEHGIRNLTTSHISERSLTIGWNYYVWDVQEDLIKDTEVLVYTAKGVLWRRIHLQKNSHLQQVYTLKWLEPCTRYSALVRNTYFSLASNEKRNSSVNFRTECEREHSSLMFTTLELILVNVCVAVILVLLLVGCRVYRNARWDTLRNKTKDTSSSLDNIVLIDDDGCCTRGESTQTCS